MNFDIRAVIQKGLLGGLGGLLSAMALASPLMPSTASAYGNAALRGAVIGLMIGAACGAWDGICRSRSQKRIINGASVGAGIGFVGGLVSLPVGQMIYAAGEHLVFRAVGWALFGAVVGASEGWARKSKFQLLAGSFGGLLGGLVGGSTYEWVFGKAAGWFARDNAVVIGSAIGLVLLGLFVGAFMGLVENLFRSAWLVFVTGRLEGQSRTLDGNKKETTIGRSDMADICILNDAKMAAVHAKIVPDGNGFAIEAAGGEVLYGRGPQLSPITRQALTTGDVFQVAGSRVRFNSGGPQQP